MAESQDHTQNQNGQTSAGSSAHKGGSRRLKVTLWLMAGILSASLVGAAVLGGVIWYGKSRFEAAGPAPEGETVSAVYTLERGRGLKQIAQDMEARGLITSSLWFRLGVMWHRAQSELKAGEYAIPPHASMAEIMNILRAGKSILYKVTIPEGLTSAQVVRLLEADPVLKGDLAEVPPEGVLLPETYLFQRGTTRADLIERMKAARDEVLEDLWANRAEDLPFSTPEEAVILASIVEKETAIAEERPRVAAVFINRLRRGMRLESDPTIIYGLTQGEPLGRGLRQSELKKITPYNTYEVDGLPPTPIGNPGRESLVAVLNPPKTKELFFVADGKGGHIFAETYRQHQRNVAAWRRIERERKKR